MNVAPAGAPAAGAPDVGEDDRIHAVLIEPQLKRFRDVHDLHGLPLTVSFEGWHRHAILAPERVYLFPRDRSRVPGLRREASTLRALEGRGVSAPRLLGQWEDREISPYPYLAVSRLPGRTWSHLERGATLEETARLLEGLGRAIASWHRLDRRSLAGSVPRRRTDVERFLATGLEDAAVSAARQLRLPPRHADSWLRTLEPLPRMAPVLVHGDVNEGQILVDEGLRVTGVLDWETAHLGHPLKDFDLGEWGYGVFAWDAHFHLLRRRMWEAYAGARGGRLPSWEAVHLAFCLSWAQRFAPRAGGDPWARARLEATLDHLRRLA